MKRYKTILLGCLAVSPLFFTSCEKEERKQRMGAGLVR